MPLQDLARRFFTDKRGRVVLWQMPNPPLWAWVASSIAARILSGRPREVAELVAFGALFAWAWLELFQGVTPFRRVLGALVLVGTVVTRIV